MAEECSVCVSVFKHVYNHNFLCVCVCVCLMLGVCNYGQIMGEADGMRKSLMGLSTQLPS